MGSSVAQKTQKRPCRIPTDNTCEVEIHLLLLGRWVRTRMERGHRDGHMMPLLPCTIDDLEAEHGTCICMRAAAPQLSCT